jgi:drug/metabolite transporter (DMT)-like permease
MMSNTLSSAHRAPVAGIYVAAATAMVSGVSIFVNSYGVKSVSSPTVYTTAKNIVATAILMVTWWLGARVRRRRDVSPAVQDLAGRSPLASRSTSIVRRMRRWLALAYVGVVGGGLAFVLFFNGLARSQPAVSAFWRDTLLPWVALFAVVFLKERIRWWNFLAIALLVGGEIVVTGGVGHLGAQPGELDVLASSGLWAIEVVVAKSLLQDMTPTSVSTVRMGVGAMTLLTYVGLSGHSSALFALGAHQLMWVGVAGALLALYVATWMTALSRTRAVDVTSVLVASALVTWILQALAGTAPVTPSTLGLIFIAVGVLLVLAANSTKGSRRRIERDLSS